MTYSEMSTEDKINLATETAFHALVNAAAREGVPLAAPQGLMYLPSQEVTAQFREACKAVLDCLAPKETPTATAPEKPVTPSFDVPEYPPVEVTIEIPAAVSEPESLVSIPESFRPHVDEASKN